MQDWLTVRFIGRKLNVSSRSCVQEILRSILLAKGPDKSCHPLAGKGFRFWTSVTGWHPSDAISLHWRLDCSSVFLASWNPLRMRRTETTTSISTSGLCSATSGTLDITKCSTDNGQLAVLQGPILSWSGLCGYNIFFFRRLASVLAEFWW